MVIFDKKLFQKWYKDRQLNLDLRGQRNRKNILIASLLLLGSILVWFGSVWIPDDYHFYFDQNKDIWAVSEQHYTFAMSEVLDELNCTDIRCLKEKLKPTAARDIFGVRNDSLDPKYMVLSWTIPPVKVQLSEEDELILRLPYLRFEIASLYINNEFKGKIVDRHLLFNLDDFSQDNQQNLDIVLALRIPKESSLMSKGEGVEYPIVGAREAIDRFERYFEDKTPKMINKSGAFAKVILAVFFLLMFLIIDGSPESLGLAVFMAFEAVAIGIGRRWLPFGLSEWEHMKTVQHFCYQMGDIMKLYFLFQIARVAKAQIMPWLIIGAAISLPYGLFREYAYLNEWEWAHWLSLTRDSIVGGLGMLVCLRALWWIRDQHLPWRKSALLVAALGAFFEFSMSNISHWRLTTFDVDFRTVHTILQAYSGLLFAVSTFLNISTLENRVYTLTQEQKYLDEMKRQLELGKSVQKAFLKLPDLPSDLTMSCYHKAAAYVSGDTYFVHWNSEDKKLTFLLNDVTGHGIQAALKAFAGNMIAKIVWNGELKESPFDRRRGDRRRPVSNFVRYDQLVQRLLCHDERIPDFNAFLGVEFDYQNETVELYRSNYNFPLLLKPHILESEDGPYVHWSIQVVALSNRVVSSLDLSEGSILILLSDGFLDTSRIQYDFVQFLSVRMNQIQKQHGCLTSDYIHREILRWAELNKDCVNQQDDKTFLVFQWKAEAVHVKNLKPKEMDSAA